MYLLSVVQQVETQGNGLYKLQGQSVHDGAEVPVCEAL